MGVWVSLYSSTSSHLDLDCLLGSRHFSLTQDVVVLFDDVILLSITTRFV